MRYLLKLNQTFILYDTYIIITQNIFVLLLYESNLNMDYLLWSIFLYGPTLNVYLRSLLMYITHNPCLQGQTNIRLSLTILGFNSFYSFWTWNFITTKS